MVGIEYFGGYDGVSEWHCAICGHRVGRWSGRILVGDDYERPFGRDPEPKVER
jgi:hypothetical protein